MTNDNKDDTQPSAVHGHPGFFDRFSTNVDRFTSRSWFFAACALIVIVWMPTFLFVPDVDTWQLLINTPTTVITFLLVALQCNTQRRSNDAQQKKMNAMAKALSIGLFNIGVPQTEVDELKKAVGLENEENT
jgi:low affinity Fe/Cu permease